MSEPLLYSQRQALAAGNAPPLQTEVLPETFRNQLVMLFVDAVGRHQGRDYVYRGPYPSLNKSKAAWEAILVAFVYGRGLDVRNFGRGYADELCFDIITGHGTSEVIDLAELILKFVDGDLRTDWTNSDRRAAGITCTPDGAIGEFNRLAQLAGVGYSFTNGEIVPFSSSYVYSQVVEPALLLLRRQGFVAAEQEFMTAHAALRRGGPSDLEDVFTWAAKAFESTMKVIIQRKGWSCPANATAKPLISCLEKNELFPKTLQTQFSHFLDLLASGVPTLGNNYGRHGGGEEPHSPPRELAEYALNLTASNIVFLVARS